MSESANGHGDHHGHDHEHEHEHGPAVGIRARLAGLFAPHRHGVGDSVDDALAGSADGIRAVKVSLVGLGLTALLQLVVVFFSGSVALMADTVHNLVDASTSVPLWLAFSIGNRPPNQRYTYGYGRAEDLAGVFVVLMIAVSSGFAAVESLRHLLAPQPVYFLTWVAAAALVGFVGNEAVAQFRIRTGRRIGSAALVADGYHARTDGFTSLAVLAGAAGVWAGFPQADPFVGLAITVINLSVLKDASVQMWHRLMDAIEPEILERTEAAARSTEGVQDVSAVRARWIGHNLHAEVQIVADADLTLTEAHAIAEQARHAILHAEPRLPSVPLHGDPCENDGHDAHADLAHHDQRWNPSQRQV